MTTIDVSTTTTAKKTIMRSSTKMTTTTFDSDDVYIGPQTPLVVDRSEGRKSIE